MIDTNSLSYTERRALQAEARRLHNAGLGYTKIARRMGLTKQKVGDWMRDGQPRPNRPRPPTCGIQKDFDRRALIYALAAAGFSNAEIGTETGTKATSVGVAINRMRYWDGIPVPRRRPGGGGGRAKDWNHKALIYALVEAGLTDQQIADEIGSSRSSAGAAVQRMRKEGIPLASRLRGRKGS